MTLYLIRHASAGDRYRWVGDDFDRPLDERGRRQAEALRTELADAGIERILSSRATRCIETVEPLARDLGIEVEPAAGVTEGATSDQALALLRELTGTEAALCSHGDVIPELVRALMFEGMRTIGARGCEKGSIWRLDVRGSDVVEGRYLGLPPSTPTNAV